MFSIHLLESGLDLWHALLRNSASLSQKVLSIFSFWPAIFEYNFDNIDQLLGIMHSYIILGGTSFYSTYADIISSAISKVISMCYRIVHCSNLCLVTVNDDVATHICKVLDDIISIIGPQSLPSLVPIILQIIAEITAEPHSRSEKMIATYICVLCRVALVDMQFLSNVSSTAKKSLPLLLELWLEKFDHIEFAYQRKLCGLALTKFIPTRDFEFLNKCGWILTIISGVVFELQDDTYSPQIELKQDKNQWTEVDRREYFNQQDVVNSVKLRDALSMALSNAESLHGEPNFRNILSELVDPAILNQVFMIVRGS